LTATTLTPQKVHKEIFKLIHVNRAVYMMNRYHFGFY